MYKWHVHSAIGRGRPVGSDISRVADGIAASLRQFSISLSRSAEDGNANNSPAPSRSQRSTQAFNEARSLAPKPSRGIDARSLAAKPPQSFTITRLDPHGPSTGAGYQGRGGSGGFRGFPGRGGRGGAPGGRGGRGGRGRGRVSRGRGRGGGVKKPRDQEGEDAPALPLNEEEKAYVYNSECGFRVPYQPTTSAEALDRQGAAVIASPRGVNETLMYKMQVATRVGPGFEHAGKHLHNMTAGNGLAIFEDPEQKAIAKKWKKTQKAGVLGQVETFLTRNETYLPEDARKLEAKLSTLLPAATPVRPQAGKAKTPT
ncbi:hypothetical protein LCER1_G006652 [Lachnellula cervina]|uniref:Uncharacterized protein n=1 Tax=Lachnellula cervina TaxID=1316786 RepID=A0A7D8UX79_9HELO|nr:hypothetical protein LCER1_G006652 [Lachnellula cervina]